MTENNSGALSCGIEKQTEKLAESVKELQTELEELYYVPLAENAGKKEGRDAECLKAAEEELESLKRTARGLFAAHQSVSAMEDELRSRTRDTKRSIKRRKLGAFNPPPNGAIDLEEVRKDHFARGLNLYKLLLLLIVGSFAGVIIEMIWCYLSRGYLESRRGLVYGPFNLLYGAGAVLLTLALYRFRNRGYFWSFAGGFIVGSVLEYVCSWGQELVLGSRSWDYSNMPLKINGRICFVYSVFWGVLGVLWIKDLYPRAAKLILKIPNTAGRVITISVTVFLVLDAAVTGVALARWSQRMSDKAAPDSGFWEFIDERFPDSRMERIFANMEFGSGEAAS